MKMASSQTKGQSPSSGRSRNVDLGAQPRDLALGDAAHAHGLDQIVHGVGPDPLDVGFLNDADQRLLGGAVRHGSRKPGK
jgi:hypothetical protein